MKIKVLEDICLSYITKSIEPVRSELFKVDKNAKQPTPTDKVSGKWS